ncbi:hypothetical protein LINGRAHAP2_LOCUS8121 [Linum grandiflorum]
MDSNSLGLWGFVK